MEKSGLPAGAEAWRCCPDRIDDQRGQLLSFKQGARRRASAHWRTGIAQPASRGTKARARPCSAIIEEITSMIWSDCSVDHKVAGVAGFEPAYGRIKTRNKSQLISKLLTVCEFRSPRIPSNPQRSHQDELDGCSGAPIPYKPQDRGRLEDECCIQARRLPISKQHRGRTSRSQHS